MPLREPLEIGDVVTLHPTAHGYVRDDPTFWTHGHAGRDPLAYQKTFLIASFPASNWVTLSEMDGTPWEPSLTGIDRLWGEANHGPGPYQLHSCHVTHTFSGKEMPCWRLKRLRDGYRLPNIMIFEKNLKICTFLNEARKAIESKGETHATNEGL